MTTHVDQGFPTNKKFQPKQLTNHKIAGTKCLSLILLEKSKMKSWLTPSSTPNFPIFVSSEKWRHDLGWRYMSTEDFPPIKNSNLKKWPIRKLWTQNASLSAGIYNKHHGEGVSTKKEASRGGRIILWEMYDWWLVNLFTPTVTQFHVSLHAGDNDYGWQNVNVPELSCATWLASLPSPFASACIPGGRY